MLASNRGPLLADVTTDQAARWPDAARKAERRVTGERTDLDDVACAEAAGEDLEERALVATDLHAAGITGAFLGRGHQLTLYVVGLGGMRRDVVGELLVDDV